MNGRRHQAAALFGGLAALALSAGCKHGSANARQDAGRVDGAGPLSDASMDTGPGQDASERDAASTDGGQVPLDECDLHEPDWVFCSGFEEGNKDIWDDYDGNPDETNLITEDPGPRGLSGNHVMRLRAPEGRGGADLVKVLPDTYDKLYVRWYIKYEDGFDFNARNHGGGLFGGARNDLGRSDYRPNGDDWFGAYMEYSTDEHRNQLYAYYRGMYMDCADPNGQCWGDVFPCTVDDGEVYCTNPAHRETVLPPKLETGRWYCVELMVDAGHPSADGSDATGAFDFWIDGEEIGPWTNLWLRITPNLKLTILWISLFHHAEHSVEGVMYDNVVVSKSRIGCL